MASTISKLKNTDSLAQWADKVNSLIGTIEGFLQTGGAFTSSSPSSADLLVYDAGWKNKTLIGEILIDTDDIFEQAQQNRLLLLNRSLDSR